MVPAPGLSLIHAHPADQWKPIVNPEINPGSDVFPTFKKVAKTRVLGGKKTSLFNKWCSKAWISICGRIKLDPYLSTLLEKSILNGLNTLI